MSTSRNLCGFSSETVNAEYETDAALLEWAAVHGDRSFPPDDHYFWAAWNAEQELRTEDFKWLRRQKNTPKH